MLDDLLATIQKKLKRLCYEFLITLDCVPPDIVALWSLYQRVLSVKDELFGCFGSPVPVGVAEVFADFTKVFEQVLSSLVKTVEEHETPARIIFNPIHSCLSAISQMMVLLREDVNTTFSQWMSSNDEQLVQSNEPINMKQLLDADLGEEDEVKEAEVKAEEQKKQVEQENGSNEEFARLMDLLGELMMSRSVFQNLSRQALLEYNLPIFSQEIKARGNRLVQVMESLEETILGLCGNYTNLVFPKRKVLPFITGEQAFFVEVNQVLEVVKVVQKEIFKRRGRFFYNFRGETIGLVFLSDFLGQTICKKADPEGIIVITDGRAKLGLGVEHWSMEQEVLVKTLSDIFAGQREIAGAAVMADGQISLMLDGVVLIKRVTLMYRKELRKDEEVSRIVCQGNVEHARPIWC